MLQELRKEQGFKPYPTCLIFKIVNHRPVHVVVAVNKAAGERKKP